MKNPNIRIVGKHITENDDELEEGYVEIEVEAYDYKSLIDIRAYNSLNSLVII